MSYAVSPTSQAFGYLLATRTTADAYRIGETSVIVDSGTGRPDLVAHFDAEAGQAEQARYAEDVRRWENARSAADDAAAKADRIRIRAQQESSAEASRRKQRESATSITEGNRRLGVLRRGYPTVTIEHPSSQLHIEIVPEIGNDGVVRHRLVDADRNVTEVGRELDAAALAELALAIRAEFANSRGDAILLLNSTLPTDALAGEAGGPRDPLLGRMGVPTRRLGSPSPPGQPRVVPASRERVGPSADHRAAADAAQQAAEQVPPEPDQANYMLEFDEWFERKTEAGSVELEEDVVVWDLTFAAPSESGLDRVSARVRRETGFPAEEILRRLDALAATGWTVLSVNEDKAVDWGVHPPRSIVTEVRYLLARSDGCPARPGSAVLW